MNRRLIRPPAMAAPLLAILALLLLVSGVCGVTLWLAFDPPFLTWQHGAALSGVLEEQLTAAGIDAAAVRLIRVREYTGECAVVRAGLARRAGAEYQVWVGLHKYGEAWQVTALEPAEGPAPVLAWGQYCQAPAPLLPEIDIIPLE